MPEAECEFRLVEHNVIELGGDKLALVSRRNSGWVVLDAPGYRELLSTFSAPLRLPYGSVQDDGPMESLWRSGLISADGSTSIDLNRARSHPTNVLIKLTDACNYVCTYCYDHKEGAGSNLSLEKAKETLDFVIDGARDERITISFHGGEPLLQFKKIKELVAYIEARRRPAQRIAYSVQTNGTLFTEEVIRFLDDHGFSVGISLDGNSAALNKFRIRRDGQTPFEDFEKLLRDHPDFVRRRCGVMTVVNSASISAIPSFALWLQARGITSLSLVLLQTMGRGKTLDLNQVSVQQVLDVYATLISYIQQGQLHSLFISNLISCLGNFLYFADGEICYRGVCMAATNFLVLAPDGSFKICDCSDTDEFLLGNSMDAVKDPMNEKRAAIRERSVRLGSQHPACSRCEIYGLCGGGCAARASTNMGDFNSIDPVECELFRYLYKTFLDDYARDRKHLFDYFAAYESQ
jgi:uncharacterized protein